MLSTIKKNISAISSLRGQKTLVCLTRDVITTFKQLCYVLLYITALLYGAEGAAIVSSMPITYSIITCLIICNGRGPRYHINYNRQQQDACSACLHELFSLNPVIIGCAFMFIYLVQVSN